MKNNMFMALTTTTLNAVAFLIAGKIDPKYSDALIPIMSLISPFVAIFLLRFYIRIDHPPQLIRNISALEASISLCKKHLKDKDSSDEFKRKTRKQLEAFQLELQHARTTFETNRDHDVTPIDGA